jgi:xanthine dehydrogenase YagR molybdenum-binding subunit
MSVQITETALQFLPDAKSERSQTDRGHIGAPMNRVDGQLKVDGKATFTAEFKIENVAYAALVCSTIAKGSVTNIDASEARQAVGFIDIITHENAPKMKAPSLFGASSTKGVAPSSNLPIMQSAQVYWDGQPVAIVVAATQEQAEHAATLVRVEYVAEEARISFDALKEQAVFPSQVLGEPSEINICTAEAALETAIAKVDQIYRTPRHTHNAIEPHATIASWEDDNLIVYDAAQSLSWFKNTIAEIFDLESAQVRVIAPFVGGGFGGKVMLWNNTVLCAVAAKLVNRPVKLVLSRADVYRMVGGRTLSEQRVALGVNQENKFVALIHTGATAVVTHNDFPEQFSFASRHLYASENLYVSQKVVYLDMVANGSMRAPGESIGTFALESAIDELAYNLKIDPIELRCLNEPDKDPTQNNEFSSRNLIEAYQRGAEAFGWANRHPEPCSNRDGKWLIGQGAATAFYPFHRFPATARVRISADGTAVVSTAAQEMGMGTATVQLQHAAKRLGLPIDRVSFQYGDTNLPESSPAGGSAQTVSIVASVAAAVEQAHRELLAIANTVADSPLAGLAYEQLEARDGGLFSQQDVSQGETYAAILQGAGQSHLEVEAKSADPTEVMKYSMHSYGAQFCEVRVNEESGEVRVSRWLGSFDTGRILNSKTASSQFRGGIIMGIGLALTEETYFDDRRGRIVNPSLAEYHVPVHLDVPPIDIIYNDIPDEYTPLGAHGVGEIGITGVGAAIANAVFNATGKRIRNLPITLDKLI